MRERVAELTPSLQETATDIRNLGRKAFPIEADLGQPDRFLVRLRNIVDVLVQDDWWIDREAIHARLPDN